jgi:hypothetical protein
MAISEQPDKTCDCPDEKYDYPQGKRTHQYQENDKAGAYFHGAPVFKCGQYWPIFYQHNTR